MVSPMGDGGHARPHDIAAQDALGGVTVGFGPQWFGDGGAHGPEGDVVGGDAVSAVLAREGPGEPRGPGLRSAVGGATDIAQRLTRRNGSQSSGALSAKAPATPKSVTSKIEVHPAPPRS